MADVTEAEGLKWYGHRLSESHPVGVGAIDDPALGRHRHFSRGSRSEGHKIRDQTHRIKKRPIRRGFLRVSLDMQLPIRCHRSEVKEDVRLVVSSGQSSGADRHPSLVCLVVR